MSEESKTPDSDYVRMDTGAGVAPGTGVGLKIADTLNDPNLSQEDKDMRLALALQQQENAAAYDAHMKKHQAAVKAQTNRTARSGTFSKLAAIRDKDQGMLSVPAAYTTDNAYVSGGNSEYLPPVGGPSSALKGATPQEIADHQTAQRLQQIEQASAGTTQTLNKIVTEEGEMFKEQNHRSGRSAAHLPKRK